MKKLLLIIICLVVVCFGADKTTRVTTFVSDTVEINELLYRFTKLCTNARFDLSNPPVYIVDTGDFTARIVYYGNKLKVSYTYREFDALSFHDKLIGFLK